MGFARKGILALTAGLGAALIAGCGGGGSLLSSAQAAQLNAELDSVAQALAAHHCTTAQNDIAQLQSELQSLGGVNSTLLENLNQGVNTIQQLTQNDCSPTTTTTRTRTSTGAKTTTTTSSASDTTTTPLTTTTSTQPSTTSTTGGQGLPTLTTTSTTGGSGTGPTTTTGQSTGTATAPGTTTATTPTTTGSTTATSPAGGATGL